MTASDTSDPGNTNTAGSQPEPDETSRPVGQAHGQPITYSQLMSICDSLEAEDAES